MPAPFRRRPPPDARGPQRAGSALFAGVFAGCRAGLYGVCCLTFFSTFLSGEISYAAYQHT